MTFLSKRFRFVLTGIGIFAFIIGATAYAYVTWYIPPQTIVLRNDGFHPRTLTVQSGDTVTFINKTNKAFWPASNNHPQHDIYAGFDSGRPYPPGSSWSFTFERKGKWGFHDHLRSSYTGSIAVGSEYAHYDCTEHLASSTIGEKRTCWSESLREVLQTKGAAAAFTKFAEYYRTDKDFTTIGCHIMAHQLGDDAYGEYLRYGKDFSKLQFPHESTYCGYGYYHGILEHMIRDEPNFEKADAFCKELISKYETTVPRIRLNCYHAIGHGFVPEPTDVEQWGNAHTMIVPAVTACKRLTADDARGECLQGIFNVIGDWMWNDQFGLRFPQTDSLSLCRTFDDTEVAHACYYELSMRLLPASKDNLVRVYTLFAASIPDDAIAGMVVNSAAAGLIGTRIEDTDFTSLIQECHALPNRVRIDCIKGLSGGFVAHGEPEREYVKAIAFCDNTLLTTTEKEVCYSNIIRTFKGAYTKEKMASICTMVDPRFKSLCVSP